MGEKSVALQAKLTKQMAQALHKYHDKMAQAPVRGRKGGGGRVLGAQPTGTTS
jgi:hypothetical protein